MVLRHHDLIARWSHSLANYSSGRGSVLRRMRSKFDTASRWVTSVVVEGESPIKFWSFSGGLLRSSHGQLIETLPKQLETLSLNAVHSSGRHFGRHFFRFCSSHAKRLDSVWKYRLWISSVKMIQSCLVLLLLDGVISGGNQLLWGLVGDDGWWWPKLTGWIVQRGRRIAVVVGASVDDKEFQQVTYKFQNKKSFEFYFIFKVPPQAKI